MINLNSATIVGEKIYRLPNAEKFVGNRIREFRPKSESKSISFNSLSEIYNLIKTGSLKGMFKFAFGVIYFFTLVYFLTVLLTK